LAFDVKPGDRLDHAFLVWLAIEYLNVGYVQLPLGK
jgi:hypothetical protein